MSKDLKILHFEKDEFRAFVEKKIRITLDGQGADLVGCALVVWGKDEASTDFTVVSEDSRIPSILVPDFVKSTLMAHKILNWISESNLIEPGA